MAKLLEEDGIAVHSVPERQPVVVEQAPTQEPKSAHVPPKFGETSWGMPIINQEKFQGVANEYDVIIDVRPTNPATVAWLKRGALPKPEAIKAKTINPLDLELGAKEEDLGLVGFFEPRLPEWNRLPADAKLRAKILARFWNRYMEFTGLRQVMTEYARKNMYEVVDGVVYGHNAHGELAPITGDHDIFQITNADGSPLDDTKYTSLVSTMKNRGMGVMHGAHAAWVPKTEGDRTIYYTVIKQHQHGGEPLMRFVPQRETVTVAYAENVPVAQTRTGTSTTERAGYHDNGGQTTISESAEALSPPPPPSPPSPPVEVELVPKVPSPPSSPVLLPPPSPPSLASSAEEVPDLQFVPVTPNVERLPEMDPDGRRGGLVPLSVAAAGAAVVSGWA